MERAATLLYDITRPSEPPARLSRKETTSISSESPWWTPSGLAPQQIGAVQEEYLTYTGVPRQREVAMYLAELQNGIPYAFLQTDQGEGPTLRYPVMPLTASSDHLPIPGVDARLHSVHAHSFGSFGQRRMESQMGMKKTWHQGESNIFMAVDPFEPKYLRYSLTHATPSNSVRFHATSRANSADRSIHPTPLVRLVMNDFETGQSVAIAFGRNGRPSNISNGEDNIVDLDDPQPFLQRLLKTQVQQPIQLNVSQTIHNLMRNIKRKTPKNPLSQLAWV